MSTYKDADEPIEIDLHLDELIEKGRDGTVKNIDFTKIWCNVALLPAYRIEYIITSLINMHLVKFQMIVLIYTF